MKNIRFLSIGLVTILFLISSAYAQDEPTGMPGDNFSLYGALDLFKKAESPEHFEELLNKEDSEINNLDLNGDGDVDYIRVLDHKDGDAHAITLQVPISKNEAQDIAVIAIERTGDESADLQIIGDEEIYGEEVIVEPYEEEANSGGKGGPSADYEITRVIVSVWWPSIRFIYRPAYSVYISPWYWGYYPRSWRTWRPLTWALYSPRIVHWRVGFRVTPTIRVARARRIYVPRRTTSITVVNRYKVNKTTYVSKRNKTLVKKGNKTAIATSNKKAAINKSSGKAVATHGNKKVAVSKSKTTKTATARKAKAKSTKKTTKVAATSGKKTVVGKKTTKTKKAKKGNKKAGKKLRTKKVKKKKS